ncbi:MAG: hypothetical protein AAGF11_44685 [Myxococcota bacterium]
MRTATLLDGLASAPDLAALFGGRVTATGDVVRWHTRRVDPPD